MRILLVNVPHTAIGSRIPDEHLPPLNLLCIGGPLIDSGHEVRLLDAEFGPMPTDEIVRTAKNYAPQAILFGHTGSNTAHDTIAAIAVAMKSALPDAWIVYGGVFPTYHWQDVLAETPEIDVIVRGEGEETVVRIIAALERKLPLDDIRGIAFRKAGQICATPKASPIRNMDAHRIGWELIDFDRYSYWGGRKAVVVQFSRGCPHLCTYCGQRGFWTKWRYRDPKAFAAELARLHREHGIELVNLADENPTASRRVWKEFLEAMIAENTSLTIVGSTRASDIVRDADILHLYRKAGIIRFLLGIETTDEATQLLIKKGATEAVDRQAIALMRQHGIVSLATYVVGFEEDRDRDYWRSLKQLMSYDPDQIQLIYATPHRWTPYYRQVENRQVLETDRRKWDYKHQVLTTKHVPPWRVFAWVKTIEACLQLRPRSLWRTLAHPDSEVRHAMRWYTRIGRKVWPYEIFHFLFRSSRTGNGPLLREFWGRGQDIEEIAIEIKVN